MPKGYWIAHVSVTDPEGWERYKTAARPAFEKYGAEFLARGGDFAVMEGEIPGKRHVVIAFPSAEAAQDCWRSPEYAAARAERAGAGTANIVVVEGLD